MKEFENVVKIAHETIPFGSCFGNNSNLSKGWTHFFEIGKVSYHESLIRNESGLGVIASINAKSLSPWS